MIDKRIRDLAKAAGYRIDETYSPPALFKSPTSFGPLWAWDPEATTSAAFELLAAVGGEMLIKKDPYYPGGSCWILAAEVKGKRRSVFIADDVNLEKHVREIIVEAVLVAVAGAAV